MRRGNAAPGGGTFTQSFGISLTGIETSESGNVVFTSRVDGLPPGQSQGMYRFDGTDLELVARHGQIINGRLLGSNLNARGINDSGTVLYGAEFFGVAGDGLYATDGIEHIKVMERGDIVGGDALRSPLSFSNGSEINNHGQVAYSIGFGAGVGDSKTILWTPELKYRAGVAATDHWDDAQNWTLSLTAGSVHDVTLASDVSHEMQGPSAPTQVRSLTVGGGHGISTLRLQGGSLAVTNGTTISSTGMLTGDGVLTGTVENNGAIVADNIAIQGQLNNNGVIFGSATANNRISPTGALFNRTGGEIRINETSLHVSSGFVSNLGRIEVIDGEFEATGGTLNGSSTGLITARDATLRFNGGLTNLGSVGVSFGTTDVFGDIANTGVINISGGAEVTFYDDIDQEGTLVVSSVGSRTGSAVVFGALSGSGGFIGGGDVFAFGDLRPGSSPASVLYDGNLFLGSSTHTFIELGGEAIGQFDQMVVTGDFGVLGNLTVSEINGFLLSSNMEFVIADVGGSLYGEFNGLGEGSMVRDTIRSRCTPDDN